MTDSSTSTTTETHTDRPRGRVGRPRANPRPLERPPQEEILLVAGRLFAKKGFSGTSTREIAEAAGLRQPSLFHYYPRKELILRALLNRIGKMALNVTEALREVEARPSAKLYRTVHDKLLRVCTATYPVGAIVSLPEIRDDAFDEFWEDNDRANANIRQFIDDAIAAGELRSEDPELAEFVLRGLPIGPVAWTTCGEGRTAEETADHVAALQLRALRVDEAALPAIREEALAIELPPEAHGPLY